MFRLSVMYPQAEGATFDMDYYVGHHIPLVREKMGEVIKRAEVDQGVSGAGPETPPLHVASVHFLIESTDDFWAAWGVHHEEILADIPNYTNIEPVVQVSEVRP